MKKNNHTDTTPFMELVKEIEMDIEKNNNGGKQHHHPYRMQSIPPRAILEVGKVRYRGYNEYGYADDNYKLIEQNEHLGRALRHIFLALQGESPKMNMSHATCRLLFALEQELEFEEEYAKGNLVITATSEN